MSDSDILNTRLKYTNGAYIKVVSDVTLIIPNSVIKIAGRYNATTRFIWCSNLISVTIPRVLNLYVMFFIVTLYNLELFIAINL